MGSLGFPTTFTVGAILALALSSVSPAGPTGAGAEGKLLTDRDEDTFIQLAMRAAGLPGLQTVVVKNGRVVWAKAMGTPFSTSRGRDVQ